MTISISPNGHGTSQVGQEDIDRAKAAAQKVLDTAGVSAPAAFAAYKAQWAEFDDEDPMTGPARVWVEARQAADVALTATWAYPGAEIFCEMSA